MSFTKKKRKSRDGPRTHDREPSPHCIPARTGTNKTLTHETNELDITNLFYLLETGFMINKNQYPLYIHYNDTTLLHYYTAAVAQRRLHTFFFSLSEYLYEGREQAGTTVLSLSLSYL